MSAGATSPIAATIVVPVDVLQRLCLDAAAAVGFRPDDAADLTAALIEGSLRSLPGQGQGVQSLAKYIDRVRLGVIDPRAEIEQVSAFGAIRLLDAHRAHGGIVGIRAMRDAIELAATHGAGVVGVRDSTHIGVAGYYAELAAEQGCIGLVFTNAAPEIAPWGGTTAVVGTNPWAVAAPTRQGWSVVLDMANSTSGKGMVRWHEITRQPIPDDWALTVDGRRTTDPVAALAGTLFPLGGAKGYAMSVMVDLMTGALTGSSLGLDCFGDEHQDVGHLLIAIRIEAFTPLDAFLDRTEKLIAQIRSVPVTDPGVEVRLPGELEALRRQQRLQDGIPIPRDRFELLLELAANLALDPDLVASLNELA
jgi:LDH2 family malate/lactate/ureidoglycolate dehydrogenase